MVTPLLQDVQQFIVINAEVRQGRCRNILDRRVAREFLYQFGRMSRARTSTIRPLRPCWMISKLWQRIVHCDGLTARTFSQTKPTPCPGTSDGAPNKPTSNERDSKYWKVQDGFNHMQARADPGGSFTFSLANQDARSVGYIRFYHSRAREKIFEGGWRLESGIWGRHIRDAYCMIVQAISKASHQYPKVRGGTRRDARALAGTQAGTRRYATSTSRRLCGFANAGPRKRVRTPRTQRPYFKNPQLSEHR